MNDETKLLKESEEKYRGLYESIPNLVVFTIWQAKSRIVTEDALIFSDIPRMK